MVLSCFLRHFLSRIYAGAWHRNLCILPTCVIIPIIASCLGAFAVSWVTGACLDMLLQSISGVTRLWRLGVEVIAIGSALQKAVSSIIH